MDTMLIDKDAYKILKWVNQFTADYSRPQLSVIHILGGSLVAGNGYVLCRANIPNFIKEYCEGKKYFSILKLTTNPYLLIAEQERIDGDSIANIQKALSGFIEDTKDITQPENFYVRLEPKNVKLLATAPEGYPLDFYSKEPENMTVALSRDVMSIIMPLHSDIKPKEKEEDGEETPV